MAAGYRPDLLAGAAAQQAVESYTAAGYEVQTTRLATIPFPLLFESLSRDELIAAVQELERAAVAAGFPIPPSALR